MMNVEQNKEETPHQVPSHHHPTLPGNPLPTVFFLNLSSGEGERKVKFCGWRGYFKRIVRKGSAGAVRIVGSVTILTCTAK